jgi:hypothetical protein
MQQRTQKPKPKFQVGDRGFILWGARYRTPAVITEDRGCLGRGGRRLYQIRIHLAYDEPRILEMPEDEIEPDLSPQKVG